MQGLTGGTSLPTIVRDGFHVAGDGGAATYAWSSSNCSDPDNATQVQPGPMITGCWILQGPIPTDVRVWGAYCDVTAYQGVATWDPTKTPGALVINAPVPAYTIGSTNPPVFIAMSQLGGPTLWGTTTDAVWPTRWSTFPARGANYSAGDLIAFYGDSAPGVFSQQVAITVDSVKSVTTSGVTTMGVIDKWHFLWGGLYSASSLPIGSATGGALAQDDAHSYCLNGCGVHGTAAGALFLPAWSGWAVLDKQSVSNRGGSYMVGDKIALEPVASGATVLREPILIVEKVSSGQVEGFDWLDYGSLSQLASDPTTLQQDNSTSSAHGTNFSLASVAWTRGPFATTVTSIVPQGGTSTKTNVFVADLPPFQTELSGYTGSTPVQYVYIGHDDGDAINNALKSGSRAAIHLPGRCGTTKEVDLPQDTAATSINPALVGDNFLSTGLYALGWDAADRSAHPLLSRVLRAGLNNAFGGGFLNITIDALGLPEGFGYYGLYQGPTTETVPRFTVPPSTVYVGPPYTTPNILIPARGNAVEIDAGKYMRVENVYIENGGIGSGNSIYQCGLDEEFPDSDFPNPAGGVGNSIISNSRFDSNRSIAGATNPDFSVHLGNSCHDSVYDSLSIYDGTKADVFEYNGNLFTRIHVNSDAANSNTGLAASSLAWDGVSPLAGVADYGAYALGNTSHSQTQCDIANYACVHLGIDFSNASHNPGQITDTQMKCGSLTTVPPNYFGVQLSDGATNTSVTGTVASSQCNVPGSQLINLEGAIDSTVSICNNSNSPISNCTQGYSGFASTRLYTQPASLFKAGVTVAADYLYAIPFVSPAGGTITGMSLYLTTSASTTTKCEFAIYGASHAAPGRLLTAAGHITLTSGASGLETLAVSSFLLLPNTLYFLAVNCDHALAVQGATGPTTVSGVTTANGNLSGTATGLSDDQTVAAGLSEAWPFNYNALPNPFGAPTYAATDTPNIYVSSP